MKWRCVLLGVFSLATTVGVSTGQEVSRARAKAQPRAVGRTETSPAQSREPEGAAAARLEQACPQARLFQEGSRITRVYGAALMHGASAAASAEQFRLDHAGLFGADAADLAPVTTILETGNTLPLMYDRQTGEYKFTLVYYSQCRDGISVYGADLRLLVRNEPDYPLVWVGSSLRRLGDFRPDARLARTTFDPTGAAADMSNFTEPQVVIWAGVGDTEVQPKMAFTFIGDNYGSPNAAKPEKWRYVVDAASGDVLYKENLIIFTDVSGTVWGLSTDDNTAENCADEVPMPIAYARVGIDSTVTYADANGNFIIPNSGSDPVTVQSPMAGRYFWVDNTAGGEETLSQSVTPPDPADFMHNEVNNNPMVRAQINGYVRANMVRDFILIYNPAYPTISTQTNFGVRVNRAPGDGYCPGNAWYDGGAINFCRASGSYPNTAYSSVVYHEYGHHLVQCGGSGQDQYGEGMSDCLAVVLTDDPILGWGFFGNCGSGLRTAINNYQYPCSGESHDCGNLISACIWATRNQLVASNTANYRDVMASLTINSVPLHSGHLITPQITMDFLTLDDNDSDILNGTPHAREICAGFGAHNMACPVGVLDPIGFQYPDGRPTEIVPQEAKTFRVNVIAQGSNPVPGTGQLHYSIDGGPWVQVFMSQSAPNEYDASLPAADCRAVINWYVSAEADDANTYADPMVPSSATYTTIVGRIVATAISDHFESDSGWTVGDAGDDATGGVWSDAAPEGTIAQPSEDHTPYPWKKCWVTDHRASGDPNQFDVDGGKTTLLSPTLDLAMVFDPVISYWRWYSNDKGAVPHSDVFVVEISDDNGGTWFNVETVGPSGPGTSGGWIRHSFRVGDFVAPTDQVKMRFVASDYGADSLVEAAIDDFEVDTFQCDILPPTPNPPSWVQVPTPISTTAVTMQAGSSDPSGVEYYFSSSGIGSHSRDWDAEPTFTDTELEVNRNYTYYVRARDGAQPIPNETGDAEAPSLATFIETPTALTFGAMTSSTIVVNAPGSFTRLSANMSGLYFQVLNVSGAPVGGPQANTWVQTQTITATGLTAGQSYRFRVKARNYFGQNETPWFPVSGYIRRSIPIQAGPVELPGGHDVGGQEVPLP